jgi:dTDP-4-amino-4,6-dideoxygalactose transaminase
VVIQVIFWLKHSSRFANDSHVPLSPANNKDQRYEDIYGRRRPSILSDWRVPLSDLDYDQEETAAVSRVLASKWLSMGPEVKAFEEEFAAYSGFKHAIAVTNGTAALHLPYLALGIGSGDEIIQPALNFVAAANLTMAVGASPVLADIISLNEPTIDPAAIERLITRRTKAVVAMHYGGYVCRMEEIEAICRHHGLALIEDACHAVGASRFRAPKQSSGRKPVNVACFSFYSNKNLATGEGGMIITDNDELADRLRPLRSHGMTSVTWDRHRKLAGCYDITAPGYNYRLDELRAALGRVQLKKLDRNNQRRRQLVAIYKTCLRSLPGWVIPFADYDGDSSYHLMVVVAPDEDARSRVIQKLREAGIQTSLHYPCLSELKAFEQLRKSPVECSRAFARRMITLPLFPQLSESYVEEICDLIKQTVT